MVAAAAAAAAERRKSGGDTGLLMIVQLMLIESLHVPRAIRYRNALKNET
jgi:hypothetical protein